MINQVQITIPIHKSLGIFSVTINKKVNFSFDNLAMFLFRETNEIETVADMDKWKKDNNQFQFFIKAAFSAVQSFYLQNRKPEPITYTQFAKGLTMAKETEIKKVMEVWQRSQSYGAAETPGKKKQPANR